MEGNPALQVPERGRSPCSGSVGWPISRSTLLLGRARIEVGILVGDPIDKFADGGVRQQPFHIHSMALKLGIREIGDQCLLANGMHGHNIAPAPALWNGMVQDHGLARWSAAEPAGYHDLGGFILAGQVSIGVVFRTLAGHLFT